MSEAAVEAPVEDVVYEPDPMDVYKPSGSVDPEVPAPKVHTADWVASNGVLYCPICGLPAPCPSAPKEK